MELLQEVFKVIGNRLCSTATYEMRHDGPVLVQSTIRLKKQKCNLVELVTKLGSLTVSACHQVHKVSEASSFAMSRTSAREWYEKTKQSGCHCKNANSISLSNGGRRFTEKVIHVQEMDSMGTASKNLSREV